MSTDCVPGALLRANVSMIEGNSHVIQKGIKSLGLLP